MVARFTRCPHCKVSLRSLGQLPIRVGGPIPAGISSSASWLTLVKRSNRSIFIAVRNAGGSNSTTTTSAFPIANPEDAMTSLVSRLLGRPTRKKPRT